MKTHDLMTAAGSTNPVPPTAFEAWSESPEGQELLQRIVAEPHDPGPAPPAGTRRFRTTAVLATGVLALGGAAAYAVIRDDHVTFEEYEYALTNAVACMREEGLTVEGPLQFGRDPGALLAIGIPGGDPTIQLNYLMNDAPRVDEIEMACRARHVGDIEQRWLEQEQPDQTRNEQRAWIDRLLECAEENGIEIPKDLSYEDMLDGAGADPSSEALGHIATRVISTHGCTPWEADN